MSIPLNDLLRLTDEEIARTKLKFNVHNGTERPIDLYQDSPATLMSWQFWNGSKRSFYEGQIAIGLVRIEGSKWLLFDVSRVTKDLGVRDGVGYEYERLDGYKKFLGRVVVDYKNSAQQNIRNAASVLSECTVHQILDDKFDQDVFPGYENVNLPWREMARVLAKPVWQTALGNQKGVYLITDDQQGRMYVGSAYGSTMLLGRWQQYVRTGHGGNKLLKALDPEYIQHHFRYAILDIYKSTIEDRVIIQREAWWKVTLMTRAFGYNDN